MSFIIEKFAKNTHYSFFSIEPIITTTYIPRNCAPQIKANKETCNFVERHHDPLWKKKKKNLFAQAKLKILNFYQDITFLLIPANWIKNNQNEVFNSRDESKKKYLFVLPPFFMKRMNPFMKDQRKMGPDLLRK